MTQDNFNLIRPLLNFESSDDFYFIQIMQRRKDNPDMKTGVKIIKEFYIDSLEQFDNKRPQIIEMAHKYNARATIRLNKRSYKKTALKTLIDIANKIDMGQYHAVKTSFSSAAGKYSADSNKTWILDIDTEDIYTGLDTRQILPLLEAASPTGPKLIAEIPSATGFHLITRPFDARQFLATYPSIEIKKDNPTNLYIP
jgi:hypothetical protein